MFPRRGGQWYWTLPRGKQKKSWIILFHRKESLGAKPSWAFRNRLRLRKWAISVVNYHVQKLDYKVKEKHGRNDDFDCIQVWLSITSWFVDLPNMWEPARKDSKKEVCVDVLRMKTLESIYMLRRKSVQKERERERIFMGQSPKKSKDRWDLGRGGRAILHQGKWQA